MKQVNGKWVITGDVLNPVSGYELITYDAMDWFMGVSSVDDMMAPLRLNRRGFPNSTSARKHIRHGPNISSAWWTTTSFRKTLAMGRKVPYELFNVLQFCDSCDYSKKELAAT